MVDFPYDIGYNEAANRLGQIDGLFVEEPREILFFQPSYIGRDFSVFILKNRDSPAAIAT